MGFHEGASLFYNAANRMRNRLKTEFSFIESRNDSCHLSEM